MFTFTQPIGGKVIAWKPLAIGDEMDVEAGFRRPEQQHLQKYELYRRRITAYGDEPRCSMDELRKWDALDLEAFAEDVHTKESARKAALRKVNPDTALGDLEKAAEAMALALEVFKGAMDTVVAAARTAPTAGVPPLG